MADSVDVLDYDIALDLSQGTPFQGDATLTVQLLRPCASIALQLVGTVDSLEVAGVRQAVPDLSHIPTAGISVGQPFTIRVWYTGRSNVEAGGWGGFHFDYNMHYNLGVGFDLDPHVTGRSVFPCRDNFHDKATYTLRMRTRAGWTAECGGMLQSRTVAADGTEHSVWRIAQPTPTYLVSVSQAAWKRVHDTVASVHGDYPLSVGYLFGSDNSVRNAFAQLDSVVPMFERCFGPYRWGRIGYIATHKGSMESVNNIALDETFSISMSEQAQSTIAHELGHAWFGNLITCAEEGDMWINEGGASFCSEVAKEAVHGRDASNNYYERNLEAVLRTTYVTDGGYRSLSNMPHNYTYGSTTYDKGWMVWHSLRGYLGDSLFYASMRNLMASCAFGNLDAMQLRDSLAAYSGVNLDDFFDFHVFGAGFVNYHVDALMGAGGCDPHLVNITIGQQGVGTADIMPSVRVPVTFFSHELDTVKRWFEAPWSIVDEVFSLPFAPAFCILDYDRELSDAATLAEAHLQEGSASQEMSVAHIKVRADHAAHVYAEHHWGSPWGTMPYGVLSTAKRYWVLNGLWEEGSAVQGSFHYVRTGYNNSTYANLDRGFYHRAALRDSLALLYRPFHEENWKVLPHTLEGNANEGYLVADSLMPGEYTLAIVDTHILGVVHPVFGKKEMNLFPNPLGRGQELVVEVDTDMPFTLSIYDESGRMVWQKEGCVSGQPQRPSLRKGVYWVKIENKHISLQSKLIRS